MPPRVRSSQDGRRCSVIEMTLDLYLVRHGATEWSENGRHTSRTDIPLLPDGEAEASRLRERLRGIRFVAAYTSDLSRARTTAALAGFPDAQVTPLLREFDYGEYEGITTSEIHRTRPAWELFHDGCPGGEKPEQVYSRAQAFLGLMEGQEGAIIVFSHGHFLRALAVAWTELGIRSAARFVFDTGGISILRDAEPGRLIQVWNQTD
jgi:broad specificity phosphatase PhoE